MPRLSWALALIVLSACSCAPGTEVSAASGTRAFPATAILATQRSAVNPESALLGERRASLRGNPEFDVSELPPAAQEWYGVLWASLEEPEQRQYFERLASSNDLYEYSRLVHLHLSAMLTAMRATGDLRLLDEVDRYAQMMRAELRDGWRAGAGREGNDGYLNWVWSANRSSPHYGKDIHETDEMGTHALVALLAWAFEVNRDQPSPSGVDYGERADFWRRYLVDHFEPKWRERTGIAWPRFPFLNRPHMHETVSFIKYHYYMYRLTGEVPYLDEARRLSDLVYEEFREASTDAGPALVWPRSIVSEGGSERYLMPTIYSTLVIMDSLDMHLEGFYGWGDDSVPERLATTMTAFVLDDSAASFARDIGGGIERAGLPPSPARDWERLTPARFALNSYALLTAWDETGELARVSTQVFDELATQHQYPQIPVGMLLDSLRGEGDGSAAQEPGVIMEPPPLTGPTEETD